MDTCYLQDKTKGKKQTRRGKVRGRPGATSNRARQGNKNPTYATDGTPQPGAETRRAGTGQTAGASYLYRGEPHARTARERGEAGGDRHRPPNNAQPAAPLPDKRPTGQLTTSHNQQPARETSNTLSSLSSLLSKHEKLASAAPKKQQKHSHQGRNGSAVYKQPKYKMDNHQKVCRSVADDRPI